MCKWHTILGIAFECPQVLVYMEGSVTNHPGIQIDNIIIYNDIASALERIHSFYP